MAFETLPPCRFVSHASGKEFIISDYIAVFDRNESAPMIYRYSDIKMFTEHHLFFLLTIGGETYKIGKECFRNTADLYHFRALIEGGVSGMSGVDLRQGKRILPTKNLYKHIDIDSNIFKASGMYTEREINSGNLVLMNNRLGRLLWLIGILITIALFLVLALFVGNVKANWYYYAPISLFIGIGVAVVFYLCCILIAKFKYSELFKTDPAMNEEITFVIGADGFAAFENCIYTASDLIPWSHGSYYIETNYVIVIVLREHNQCFWIPKRLFPKDAQGKLSEFISARLQSR